ncbi:MAG: hypothetical protein IPO92_15205 [Saprospiraceae bacterium]|nr:hypothetical protein [Saprospiraceae bacterium]
MKQLKKWNRQCWVSEYYTDNQGIVQDAYLINSVALAKLYRDKTSSNNIFQPNNWNLQGPVTGDKGIGRIDRITFHPNNPNIMYAGSPHGGLFVSINGGISWDALAGFLPSLGVSGIAIDPINTNIMYVLTGDGDTGPTAFVTNYLYRSDSKGVF